MLENLYDFIAMGDHGVYIWSAYAITLVGLVITWVVVRRNKLRALQWIIQVSKNKGHVEDK